MPSRNLTRVNRLQEWEKGKKGKEGEEEAVVMKKREKRGNVLLDTSNSYTFHPYSLGLICYIR